jgi:hypothetical protein
LSRQLKFLGQQKSQSKPSTVKKSRLSLVKTDLINSKISDDQLLEFFLQKSKGKEKRKKS